jgi:hypothetical protein
VTVVIDLMGGLFSSKPPPGVNVCGVIFAMTKDPQFTIGCVPCWTDDPNAAQTSPGAVTWRPFPSRGVAADAGWYQPLTSDLLYWRGATWGITLLSEAFTGIPASFGGVWQYLENECARLPADSFQQTFFSAWKTNKSYSFNGLKPQPDYQVLIHVLRLWNTAHAPSKQQLLSQINLPSQPNSGTPYPMYVSTLVESALGNLSPDDSLVKGQSLVLNLGPKRTVPTTAAMSKPANLPAPGAVASTAKGAAIAVGVTAAGIGIYAAVMRVSFGHAAGLLFDKVANGAKILGKRVTGR